MNSFRLFLGEMLRSFFFFKRPTAFEQLLTKSARKIRQSKKTTLSQLQKVLLSLMYIDTALNLFEPFSTDLLVFKLQLAF